jgi:hypothetical protein
MSFPKFSDLPAELRLKIWSYALPTRRVLEIGHRSSHPFHGPSPQDSALLSIKTKPHDLALLSTCFESRALALKTYRIYNFHGFHSPFFFNPNRDAVLMSNPECLQDFCSGAISSQFRASIKHLAIDPLHTRLFHNLSGKPQHPRIADAMTYTRFEALNLLSTLLRDFSGLQEFTILHPKTHVDLPFADMLMVRLEWLWASLGVGKEVVIVDDGEEVEVWQGPHISNVLYDFTEADSTMRKALEEWKGCQGRRQMCRGRWHS